MIYLLLVGLLVSLSTWRLVQARRGRGRLAQRDDPAFDPAEGHPQVREALELLKAQNWAAATALYGRLPPSDRYHLVQGMGEVAGNEPIAWPQDADSAILVMQAGMAMIGAVKTIQASPGPRPRPATMQAIEAFLNARKLLAEAALRNAHDSTNFALQIRNETARGGDRSLLNGLVGRIDASEENNLFAAMNHVLFVSPLAHGSIDEMWRTASDYASRAPNAAWLAIAARAHIEEWVHCMRRDRSLTQSYIAKLQDDGFIEHIRKLDRDFWRRDAQTKMSRAEAHVAHNHFAFLLRTVRLDEMARPHLEAIGPFIAAEPWRYLPDGATRPTRLLMDMRRAAGLREQAM